MTQPTKKIINLKSIRIDGGTQARVAISNETLTEYAAAVSEGGNALPPVVLFHDGSDYWLADGFHRYHAHAQAGRVSIDAEVRTGTQRDAIYYSLGANTRHGLRLSNDDKRRAVSTMLADPEWSKMSDREIAKHCGCAHPLVGQMRNPAPKPTPKPPGGAPTPQGGGSSTTPTPPGGAPTPPAGGSSSTPQPDPTPQEKAAEDAHGDSDIAADLEAAYAEIETLQQEIEVANADDLKAEAIKWKRIADIARNRQNELQETVKKREDELGRLTRSLRRIGKAVGEEDPTKIAATVEAFVRSMKEKA